MGNVYTPGEISVAILLKLSSVLSDTALRNDGTKKEAGCIEYSSLCKGCNHSTNNEITNARPPIFIKYIFVLLFHQTIDKMTSIANLQIVPGNLIIFSACILCVSAPKEMNEIKKLETVNIM